MGSAQTNPKYLCELHVLLLLDSVGEGAEEEGEGASVVTVRDVLVSVTVVVRTSVDVETGSLQPNQPGSLHVDVVCVVWLVSDAEVGEEVGLGCASDVLVDEGVVSLQPHHPGVAQ